MTLTGRGTGRVGKIGRGGGPTAGRMTHQMMMNLEGKGGGITATTRGVITGGMHLVVTVMAVSPHMKGSDPASRRATRGQRAMDWVRMSDIVHRGQAGLERRAGAKEER